MKVHLIGIGGIGVSALAQYYLSKGHQISGSDLVASEITDFLKNKGIKIKIGQVGKNIEKDIDLVIYSPAVKKNNPEYKKAKKLGIKLQSYPEALGDMTREYHTIAVAGAHGKSTTTTMIALILVKAGLDPTVIVGTKVKEFGNSNFRAGKSKLLVIEACEYDSSFLHYSPKVIVVTNIDKEHLDYFKTFANVKKAFRDFIKKLPPDGRLIENKSDENLRVKLRKILKVPGEHNVSNALQALEAARSLDIPDDISISALSEFKGTWRRFEIKKGKAGDKKITVVSDYGHHPNEILATLKAARDKYPGKRIWCVFQPHQHQRTHYLFNDFIKAFLRAPVDEVIITDIYDVAGREERGISKRTSSKKLVEKIKRDNVIYLPLPDIFEHVKKNIQSGDVLIIMGAGDIYMLADKF